MLYIIIALCASPPAPANGQVTLTGNSVGDTATYTCNTGYELSGQNASTCMLAPDNNNTASFEPPAPTCDREFPYIATCLHTSPYA